MSRRRGPGSAYRKFASLRFALTRDRAALARFLSDRSLPLPVAVRARLAWRFFHITNHVRAYHTQGEMFEVTKAILQAGRRGPVTVVEAGAAHGASTAKLSLAVARAGGGTLHVFDTFRGMPANDELHEHLDGRPVRFREGAFRGRLAAVRRVVETFGAPEVCRWHKGLFEDTLPQLEAPPLDVVLLDVDLWSSTATCLRYLLPRLRAEGVVLSQDGHLKTIVDRLRAPDVWVELGLDRPIIEGVGERKLLRIYPDRKACS
ncbi:MAG: TylF/MycF/NovP-related O-methyltransferase [Myxococcota bacterium]